MFKSLKLFRVGAIPPAPDPSTSVLFTPTGPTQSLSAGLVPPRDGGAIFEMVDGALLIRVRQETRTVPKPAVDRALAAAVQKHEQDTGRKPGRKQLREMKDTITLDLLPRAFPRVRDAYVLLDPVTGLLWVGSTATSVVDSVIGILCLTFDGLKVAPLHTERAPAKVMTDWLMDPFPREFDPDLKPGMACRLVASDDTKAAVGYRSTDLDAEDIRERIKSGMQVLSLDIERNGRVSMTLDDDLGLSGVELLDVVFEDQNVQHDDAFDSKAYLWVVELREVVNDIVAMMGGARTLEAAEA